MKVASAEMRNIISMMTPDPDTTREDSRGSTPDQEEAAAGAPGMEEGQAQVAAG